MTKLAVFFKHMVAVNDMVMVLVVIVLVVKVVPANCC